MFPEKTPPGLLGACRGQVLPAGAFFFWKKHPQEFWEHVVAKYYPQFFFSGKNTPRIWGSMSWPSTTRSFFPLKKHPPGCLSGLVFWVSELVFWARRLYIWPWVINLSRFWWPLGTFWTLWTEFEPSRGKVAGRVVKMGPKVAAALSRKLPPPPESTPGTAQGEDNRRGRGQTTIPHAC